jgi:DNA-directed RNA polymerase specialized sigma subunit
MLGGECKVDLHEVKKARGKVDLLVERIALLRSAMEVGERILKNGHGSNYPTDRLSRDMVKLDELERSLIEAALTYEDEAILAEDVIEQLPEQQQTIIRYRYIGGLRWADVAAKTNYSIQHCFFIHKNALAKLKVKSQ